MGRSDRFRTRRDGGGRNRKREGGRGRNGGGEGYRRQGSTDAGTKGKRARDVGKGGKGLSNRRRSTDVGRGTGLVDVAGGRFGNRTSSNRPG